MFLKRLLCLQRRKASSGSPPQASCSTASPPPSTTTAAKSRLFVSICRHAGWKPYTSSRDTVIPTVCKDWSLQWHRLKHDSLRTPRLFSHQNRCRNWPLLTDKLIRRPAQESRVFRSFLNVPRFADRCHGSRHPLNSAAGWLGSVLRSCNNHGFKVLGSLLRRGDKMLVEGRCELSRPHLGMFVRALSFSCTRSHICLGAMTLILGGMNQPIAEAQAPSQHISSLLSPSLLVSFVEFLGLIARATFLLILFMPAVLTSPFSDMFGGFFRKAWLHLVHHTLELAGAAFIKWGQWAATRPDLFPRDLCAELTRLHTKAPAHSFSHTVQTVEGAFGRKLHEIFEDFEEEPVASGSIAQVHRATLRFGHPGKKKGPMVVAVKVRHPGVSDIIRRDFIIIKWIANLSTLMPGVSWLRLDESVRQFAVFMLTQVDLAREATHLSRFLYNFRSWRDVSFPRPVYPLVHPAVLVESYEQGESISRFVALSEKSRINRSLAHIGTNTLLKMLLVDNFIHADMHPGNILVRVEKGKRPPGKGLFRSRPHVVFLDVGLTAELSQDDRSNLLEFFKAVAVRDGKTAAECTLKFSREQRCPNPDAFVKEVDTSFKFWGSKAADVIHPGECMQDLLEQVRRHRVNVDGDVCTVMVTIMVLEGWQRKLDPDYNIMNTLQSLIFKVDMVESLSYTMTGIMAP